ncbi:AMP-dependent synthetase and ligase [Ferroglobus placidus DSM 10642]|uniref:AMP-dependent synthetase and ligase n=1 Tax=Ferroglobus placidus (strain DSM 10642 / AEDII12DO) TaxID=589924 RepID=D3RXJ3_FERPA|nr:long-chain fatty acid--CoA ligase [Ferroglobus placidus]ADC65206.1 AMP-dependent synthetase and ligase [Ferroglobus placidus DSM 10642]QCO91678.1 long-chain fatty acid-CoA ligase [synthetic construct]
MIWKKWYKYIGWPEDIEEPDKTPPEMLAEVAKEYADKDAIIYYGHTLTYREFFDQVLRVANAFSDYLEKGDRISFFMPNCPQFNIGYFAALSNGMIAVHTNVMYTERELEYQLNHSGAKAIVTLDILYDRVKAVFDKTPLEHIIVTSLKDYLPPTSRRFLPYKNEEELKSDERVIFFTELLKKNPKPAKFDVSLEDVASLTYTGGTTGRPKGAVYTHRNLMIDAKIFSIVLDARKGKDVFSGLMPMFHGNGIWTSNMNVFYNAGTVVLFPYFEAGEFLRAVERYRITQIHCVPTHLVAIVNHPEVKRRDLSSVRVISVGSAPVPIELLRKVKELMPDATVIEQWGLTEAAIIGTSNPVHGVIKVGSAGMPVPSVEIKIVDPETGKDLPPGEENVGEIVLRSKKIIREYWNDPERTKEAIRDGWLYTGDIGYMDEDGYIYIVDRKKDMIIVSGYNVYPSEVEEVLYRHPAVLECAVIGVPDEYRGEVPKAFIVLKPEYKGKVTEEEIIEFARKHLAAYKIPRIVEFRDELPKSAVGKILRRVLREEERKKRGG